MRLDQAGNVGDGAAAARVARQNLVANGLGHLGWGGFIGIVDGLEHLPEEARAVGLSVADNRLELRVGKRQLVDRVVGGIRVSGRANLASCRRKKVNMSVLDVEIRLSAQKKN